MASFLEKASATLVSVHIPEADAEVERIVRDAYNFSTRSGRQLMMVTPPTPDQRRLLSERQRMLGLSMVFDRQAVALLIAQLLNCFPAPIKENETVEQVITLFVRELSQEPKTPTWAVAQAVSAIRLGRHPEMLRAYPRPATFAIRRIADAFAWKAKAESVAIADVLNGRAAAPQVSPEDRAKLSRRFAEFAADMAKRNAARAELDHREDAEKLAAMIGQEAFQALPNAPKPKRSVLAREAAKIAASGRR